MSTNAGYYFLAVTKQLKVIRDQVQAGVISNTQARRQMRVIATEVLTMFANQTLAEEYAKLAVLLD